MAVDNLWLLWYAVGARDDPLAMAGKRSILKGHKPGSVLRFCLAGGLDLVRTFVSLPGGAGGSAPRLAAPRADTPRKPQV